MSGKPVTAQELYNLLYQEAFNRRVAQGKVPKTEEEKRAFEVDVFRVLVTNARKAVVDGDAPREFLDELAEVVSMQTREEVEAKRMEERERALREGTVLDIEDLLK